MSRRILIPHILTQAVRVRSLVEGKEFMTGSGFTCSDLGQTWLVTNRHVALGREPGSNHWIERNVQPTQLRIDWVSDDLSCGSVVVDLLDVCTPRWVEHPPLAHRLDLVAVPVPNDCFVDVDLMSALEDEPAHVVTVGDPVAVIGFPFGMSAGVEGLPIMFSGIVASPPGIPLDGLPRFLIDSRTRRGVSGAPVFYYPQASAGPREGAAMDASPRPAFLGLYCGRVKEESDLGYVIDATEVARTIVHRRPGQILA